MLSPSRCRRGRLHSNLARLETGDTTVTRRFYRSPPWSPRTSYAVAALTSILTSMFFMQFYGVKVGIQSPEGITTTRTVPIRFNEFLKLYSELRKEFPKKNLPPAPPKRLVKTKGKKVLVERICALECWMTKLLSDIDISRTAPVAIFLELEAAARQACCELNQNDSADMDNSGA
ncbi:hypothetical protein L2E82_20551 [Cichorium intybus]|uniref:Uncharacterized protein n=1 Tax=Cichorium intybus TaxID=13427 RepID=A0ACB9DTZ2_CICIN|nr:hypothetical protein L2E82_20551 [Cichorium intybus]